MLILVFKSLEVDDPPLSYFAQMLLVLFEVLLDLVFLFIEGLEVFLSRSLLKLLFFKDS